MQKNFYKNSKRPNLNQGQSTDSSWILKNLEETIALGETLLKTIPNIKLLLLEGPLGVGKTSLVKGIAIGLGIHEPITSPTFPLAQHYLSGDSPLFHLDLYRLENHKAADELFIQEEEEAKTIDALMIVEWPERLKISLRDAWKLNLQYGMQQGRSAHLIPPSSEAIKNDWTSS